MNANENLPPSVVTRLMKDIRALCKSPPEGIRLSFTEESLSNITAEVHGPEQTPFEGGVFRVRLVLGPDFPQAPPKAFFLTKIFHPNVSAAGEICVSTLKKDWKPTHGLEHILLVVRCLLIVPNAESALNPEAGRLLLDDYAEFSKRARLMTRIHARPKDGDMVDSPRKRATADEGKDAACAEGSGGGGSSSSSSSSSSGSSSSSASAAAAAPVAPAAAPAVAVAAQDPSLEGDAQGGDYSSDATDGAKSSKAKPAKRKVAKKASMDRL